MDPKGNVYIYMPCGTSWFERNFCEKILIKDRDFEWDDPGLDESELERIKANAKKARGIRDKKLEA